MNTLLKSLMAAGIAVSLNVNALAGDTTAAPLVQEHIQLIERMKTLTPEQRLEHHKAMREYMDKMPPEERQAMHAGCPNASPADCPIHGKKKLAKGADMSPEQCAERRKAMREYWDKMPSGERQEWRMKMHSHMTPEERAEHRKKMHENFGKISPEERQNLKRGMSEYCPTPLEDCPYGPPAGD